jgi:hypothetical protein
MKPSWKSVKSLASHDIAGQDGCKIAGDEVWRVSQDGVNRGQKSEVGYGYFVGGLSDPPLEKQIPRAKTKALGMTKSNNKVK